MKSIRVRISLILLIAMLVISLGIAGAFLTGSVQSATAYDSADSTSVAQDATASPDGTPSGSLSTANDEALVASDAAVNVEVVADDELATTAATSVKQPVFMIQNGVDSKGDPTFVNHPNSTTYTTSITVSPDQTQYVRFTGVDMNEDTTTGNLTFAVSNSNYMNYTASGSNGSRIITVGIVPGTPVGNYTVTFTLKNADDAWQVTGAKSALVYTIAVTKGQVELPTLSSHDSDNDHKKTFEYTGSAQSFAFVSKYTKASFTDIFTVTINTNQVSAGNLGNDSAASFRYNMTATNAGVLTVTLAIKETAKYDWLNNQTPVTQFTIQVDRQKLPATIALQYYGFPQSGDSLDAMYAKGPIKDESGKTASVMEDKSGTIPFHYEHQFATDAAGNEQHTYYAIDGVTSAMITTAAKSTNNLFYQNTAFNNTAKQYRFQIYHNNQASGWPTIGDHTFTMTPTANYCWSDGTTGAKTVKITITKQVVKVPKIVNGHLGSENASIEGVTNAEKTSISYTYAGTALYMDLNNWHKQVTAVSYSGLTYTNSSTDASKAYSFNATNYGTFTATLRLGLTDRYIWEDYSIYNTSNDRVYTLTINRGIVPDLNIVNGLLEDGKTPSSGTDKPTTTTIGTARKVNNATYYNWLDVTYADGANLYLEVKYHPGVSINNTWYQVSGSATTGGTALGSGYRDTIANSCYRMWYSAYDGNSCRLRLQLNSNYTWEDGSTGTRDYFLFIDRKAITGEHQLSFYDTDSARSAVNKKVVIDKGNKDGFSVTTMNYVYHIPYSNSHRYFSVEGFNLAAEVSLTTNSSTYIVNQGFNANLKTLDFYVCGNVNPYTCVYNIALQNSYCWEDGTRDTRTVTIIVDKATIAVPTKIRDEKIQIDDKDGVKTVTDTTTTVTYTYATRVYGFEIEGFIDTSFVTATFTASNGGSGQSMSNNTGAYTGFYHIQAQNAGTYTLSLALANTARFQWDDYATNTATTRYFVIVIKRLAINGPSSEIKHNLISHGDNSSWTNANPVTVYSGPISAGVIDFYWTVANSSYTYLLIENMCDASNEFVTVAIDNNENSYNTNYIGNSGFDKARGIYRFHFYRRDTSIIRTTYMRLTPTANYCWEGSGTYETRRLDIRINKCQIALPYLDGMSGDATNDKGEALDNTLGGTYDEATRTATFTYTGAPIHLYIANYTSIANDVACSGSKTDNTPTGHWDFYATNAGTYTINFRFNTGNNYYYNEWATDPDLNATIAGKNVQIFTLVIERAEVEAPTLLYTNNQYSNVADKTTGFAAVGDTLTLPFRPTADHYFFLKDFDGAKMSQTMAGPANSSFSRTADTSMGGLKGYITQTNTGYTQVGQFTVTITPNANHRWKGVLFDEGIKAKVYTIVIEAAKVKVPKFSKGGDMSGDASLYKYMKIYNGSAQIASLIDIDSSMVTVSTSGPSGGTQSWTGTTQYNYTATNAGVYTITVSLRANFSWDDAVTTGTRVYEYTIRRAGISLPEIRYYGLDSTYASSSLQSDKTTDSGAMYLTYNRQGDIYHRFEFTNVNSTNVTIAANNNTTYQNGSFVSGDGNLYRCWLRQYTTNATRAEGWWWTVTPTDNYAWEIGDGTIDASARTLTIFLLKVEVDVPELVLPKAPSTGDGEEDEVTTPSVPSNYDPSTRTFTLTYTGQQQSITFSGYDRNVITNSIAISDAASGVSMTSNLIPDSSGYVYFYAINAGTYVITLTVSNTSYYQWKGTTVNPVYTVIVQRAEMDVPTFVKLDVASGNPIPNHPDIDQGTRIALETYSVTNTTLSYMLTGFKGTTYYSAALSNTDVMTQSVDNSAEQNTIILKNYSATDYRITLTPTANYRWKSENWDAKVFIVRVQQKKVALPRLYDAANKAMVAGESMVLTYTGQPQNIMFVPLVTEANNFWESFDATQIRYNYTHVLGTNTVPVQYTKNGETEEAMVNYSYVTLTTVNTYNVDVYLANGNYIWADGVKYDNYKRFTVQITQMRLPVLEMEYNGVVEPSNIITVEYSTSPLTFFLKRPAANNGVVSNGGYTPGYNSSYFSGFSVIEEVDAEGNKTGNNYYQVTMKPNAPGTYSVTMDTANTNYHWDGEGGRTQKTYQVIVTKKTIQTPEIYLVEPDPTEENPNNTKDTLIADGHSVDYTGNIYQIKFKKVHSSEVSISGDLSAAAETGAMWDNGATTAIRTARNAATYTITIKIANTTYYQWASGETTMTQRFIVNPMEVTRPTFYWATEVGDKDTWEEIVGSTTYNTVFSGINQFVLLYHETAAAMKFSVATSNSSYNLTMVDTAWATEHYVQFYQSNACTYTIRATLQANYAWKGGSTVAASYTFYIEPKDVAQPRFNEDWFKDNIPAACSYNIDGLNAEVDYTGAIIQAQITGYDMDVMNLKGWYYWNSNNHGSYTPIQNRGEKYISFNNVRYTTTYYSGSYRPASITVGLINANNYKWNTGGTDNITFTLQVNKQNVETPDMVEVITTEDAEGNITETYTQFNDNAFTTTYRTTGYDFRIRGIEKSQVRVAFTRAVNLLNGNGISPLPTINWVDGENNANIHMSTAGSYTVTVSLIDASYYQWKGTTNTDAKPFVITINRQVITLPTLEGGTLQSNNEYLKTVVYDGTPQSLKMLTTQADYFTRTGGTNYTVFADPTKTDKDLTYTGAVNVGTYKIILGFSTVGNANLNYVFGNETVSQTYTLEITPKQIDIPTILTSDGMNDSATFDGGKKIVVYTSESTGRTLVVLGYNPTDMSYTWSGTKQNTETDEQDRLLLKLTAQNAGTYTVTFNVTNNYCWKSTGAIDRAAKTLQMQITSKGVAMPTVNIINTVNWVSTVDTTSIRKDITFTYNGTGQGFEIVYAKDIEISVTIEGGVTETRVADKENTYQYTVLNARRGSPYYVRFHISNGNFKWADGLTDTYRYVYILMNSMTVKVPTIVTNTDDPYADDTASWTNNYKYIEYNTTQRFFGISGFDGKLMGYSKTSSLSLYVPPTPTEPEEGEDGDEGDDSSTNTAAANLLTFYATNAATYSVTFTLANTSNYIWETGNTDGQPVYFVITKKRVTVPAIEGSTEVFGSWLRKSVVFNGQDQTMVLTPWNTNEVEYFEKHGSLSVSADSPNTFYARNYLNNDGYWVRIRLKNYSNYEWSDKGTDYRYYYLRITPQPVAFPTIVEDDDKATATYDHSVSGTNYGVKTTTYTGVNLSIRVTIDYGKAKVVGFTSGMTLKDNSLWEDTNELTYQATNVGTYTITFGLESSNYMWSDSLVYDNRKTVQFVIRKIKISRPSIEADEYGDGGIISGNTKTVGYSEANQFINIKADFNNVNLSTINSPSKSTDEEWKKENLLIGWATNVNTYTFRFSLKNTNNMEWDNQTTANIDIVFVIEVKKMAIPQIVGYGSNTTMTTTFDADNNGNPITQYMYLSNIPDNENLIKIKGTANTTEKLQYKFDEENKQYVCSASLVANYWITLGLKDTNYCWTDGTKNDRVYYFNITRKPIDLPKFYHVTTGVDDEGEPVEYLAQVAGGYAQMNYDGEMKNFRLTGVLNGIVNITHNSIEVSNGTYSNYNGNLTGTYDSDKNEYNYKVSQVYLEYRGYTIDYVLTMSLDASKRNNYVWNDGANSQNDKTYKIRINRMQIELPRIEDNPTSNMYTREFAFDNQAHSMTLSGVDQKYMTATSTNGTLFKLTYQTGNKLLCEAEKDVRNNQLYFTLLDQKNTTWTVSSNWDVANKNYYLNIVTAYVVLPSVIGNTTVKYTGSDYTIQMRDVLGDEYMTYTCSNTRDMSTSYDATTKILTIKVVRTAAIGNYSLTFKLNNYTNMRWANLSYNYQDKGVGFTLQKAQVAYPQIVGNSTSLKKSVTYSGKVETIELTNYERDLASDGTPLWMYNQGISTLKFDNPTGTWNEENETMDFKASNVGTYTIRVYTNAYCTFTDGSTYKDYTLEITKAVFEAPAFVDDGNGVTAAGVKTFTYNFQRQTATLTNVINKPDDPDATIHWRDITGYSNGTDSEHRLAITYNADSKTASISARYIGTYYIRFEITTKMYTNSKWSTTTSNIIDYRIVVNRAVLAIPTVVRADLAANESVSGNYKYSTYNGSFILAKYNNVDDTYINWVDTTNYSGRDENSKAVFEYDKATKTLTLKAKYAWTYSFQISLKDYTNSNWSGYGAYDYRWTYGMVINKFVHAYPTVQSGCPTSVVYTGTDIEFVLKDVVQGTDQYEIAVIEGTGKMTELDWSEGVLTLTAKEVGRYRVTVKLIDSNNASWTRYTSLTFDFIISRKALSAELTFSSPNTEVNDLLREGATSWPSGMPVFLNANITGLNNVEGEKVGITAYWYNNNTPSVTTLLEESGTRRYALPTTLAKGTYYAVIAHATALDNYTLGTYKIKFVISADPAGFTENDLQWQYKIDDGNNTTVNGTHSTANSALELDYTGGAYSFSITLSEAELKKLNVRLVSYEGDTVATNYSAVAYCVTVTLTAYDSSYYFPKTSYKFYYKINRAKFNLSGVSWDYKDPFTYDGEAKNVEILGSSLPAGLSVASYSGSRDMVEASEGKARGYITGVSFTVANANYVTPLQSDPTTYTGTFSWTFEWNINKAGIDVQWKPVVKVDENDMIFNIPVLVEGSEKVSYTFERWIPDESDKENGGYWRKVDKVTYSQTEITYRVTPALTDGSYGTTDYRSNYKLVPFEDKDTVAHEFTVGGDQIPVMFQVLINGKSGKQFPYTGSPYVATATVDQDEDGRISIIDGSMQITYKRADGTILSSAPTAVGKYAVTITLKYNVSNSGGTAQIESKVEDDFEIIKGTLDTSSLVWTMNHTSGKYTYDASQGKWVDIYGAEKSKFVYNGDQYTLTLDGQSGLSSFLKIEGLTGTSATENGKYEAKFAWNYDTASWNAPTMPNILKWSIEIAEINMSTASWTYDEAFTYELANGTAVVRTVQLQNLPAQLSTMISNNNATITYTGNSASAAGTYTAKVTISIRNTNYKVVYPDTLSDTLTWTISPRKLTIPEANGKWNVFDGKAHDLMIEACSADSDWADFYDVALRYSRDGKTYLNYTGYNSVKTDAFHAFYYELKLTIKSSVNPNTTVQNAVWENETSGQLTVTFNVEKLVATVIGWDGDFENTVVMTDYDDIVLPNMITYVFTGEDGKTYTQEEAGNLGGGIKITVTPAVASAFTDDVTIAYVDDNVKQYEYTTRYEGMEWLAYPKLDSTSAAYTGSQIEFTIANWDYYSKYLETTTGTIVDVEGKEQTINSALLKQTEAGTYYVFLKIRDTANASWNTVDGSLDRTTVIELAFTITAKTIEVPTIKSVDFTGTVVYVRDLISADILNFIELKDAISASNEGTYSFKAALKNTKSCVWNDGTTEEKTITWTINQKILSTPDAGGWTVFDGNIHDLIEACGYAEGWDKFFTVTIEYSKDGETFDAYTGYETDKPYSAYAPGLYKITFAIKSGLNTSSKTNVIWSNNETANQETTVTVSNLVVTVNGWNEKKEQSTVNLTSGATASTRFFEYIIKDELGEIYSASDVLTAGVGKLFSIELAVKDSEAFKDANGNYYIEILYTDEKYQKLYFTTEKILIEKPELKIASKEFNRNEQAFEINDWTNLSKYLSMDQPLSYLRQTEAGTYSITFSFKENSVAVWSDGTAEPYTLTFTITAKEIEKPVIANAGYTGSEIDVLAQYLLDNGSDYIVINNDSNKGTAAGEYTLSLSLKYPDSTVWAGGDNEDLELKWNITQNKLSTPSNNGKWTVFDGANHDLYELCGLQSDWSNFYNVTIQYSADGETYGTFNGSTAYNAGNYKLTFQIKAELNPEGAENVVWSKDGSKDDIEIVITVAKLELNVIAWTENKNASTVQLESGSLPESGVSYMFRNASGTEVTEADVLAAGEGVKFSKELVVSDTTNIAITYEEATLKKYYFVMVVHEMEIPEMTTTSVAYTGKNNIFYINDWDLYSPYVEIVADASDSLTQQDAGKYQVLLRIKDTTIATWSDGSIDDVTLYFEVTQIVVNGRWDNKNLPHTFVVMGDYPVSNDLLSTLTYTDKDGATVTAADLKQGGTYTATVAIARSYATNYVFDENIELTSTFTMPIDYTELSLPTLRNAKLAYNGSAQTFEISRWDALYADYLEVSAGSLTQTNAGKYQVTLHIKDDVFAIWKDGTSDDVTLEFEITAVTVNATWDTEGSIPTLDTSATVYAGGELPAGLITYSFKDDKGNVFDVSSETFAAGVTYYATATIHSDYIKNFTFASDVQSVLVFTVEDGAIIPTELTKLDKPTLVIDKQQFTGGNLTFAIENWDVTYKQYLEVVGDLTVVDAKTYSVTVRFKDGATAIWATGGMEDVVLTFTVTPKTITGSWIFDDEDAVHPYVELIEDGFGGLPSDLLSYVITDAEGNVVESVKGGTSYKIVVSVTDTNYAFDSNFETEKVFKLNSDGTIEEIVVVRMELPVFEQSAIVFDGTAHTFTIVDFDKISKYVEVKGDSLTQTQVGKYKVTFHIIDAAVATWVGGNTGDYSITFEVLARTTALPVDMPEMLEDTLSYTGQPITFEIADWYEKYADIVRLLGDDLTQTEVGVYNVTLHIKDTSAFIWSNGKTEDITLTFEITQHEIVGAWELGERLPFFNPDTEVFGEYPEGLFKYTIKDSNGNVVEFKYTKTEVTYYMYVELTNDSFKFADDVNTTFLFRYSESNELYAVEVQVLDKPQFVEPIIAYDGDAHTFVIDNWDYLSQYLTMTGDSLTQSEVGEYRVTFTIKDITLAMWEDETYRTHTVIFKIEVNTNDTTELDTPVLNMTSVKYDGKAHTFEILDWATKYEGLVEISGDDFTQTKAGKYSVTLVIKNKFLYKWANGTSTMVLNFEIESIKIGGSWVWGSGLPRFELSSGGGTASEAQIAVDNDDAQISDDEMPELTYEYVISVRENDGYKTVWVGSEENLQSAIERLWPNENFYMTIRFSDPNYELEEEIKTIVFRLNDENEVIEVETGVELDDVKLVIDAMQYDGMTKVFEIQNWDYLKRYVEIVEEEGEYILQQSEIGSYSLTLRLIDPSLATWKKGQPTGDRKLMFSITAEEPYVTFDRPSFENDVMTYTGQPIEFKIKDWERLKKYVGIREEAGVALLTQTEVDSYEITLYVTDNKLTWSDGTKNDVTLRFKINKRELMGTWNKSDKVPTLDIDNSGYVTALPDGVIVSIITDSNGNVVDRAALADGEIYLMTNTVGESHVGSYQLPSELRMKYFKYNANGTWEEVGAFPAEEKPDLIVWLAIAVSVILVVFLVALVIFMLRVISERKRQNRAHEDLEQQKIDVEAEALEEASGKKGKKSKKK